MSQEITGPDDFSPQDWQELYEIKEQVDETAEQTGIPRRDILKGAGLLAAGSLAGGISAQQAIEKFVIEAEAQASTSDSDGNVGTPSDPVDVFAEGIDSNSVSTGEIQNNTADADIQTAWDGLVVPVAPGLGASDAVDPSTTATPIADADSKVNNASGIGGAILLPPDTVDEEGPLALSDHITLRGWGETRTKINFTNATDPGHGFLFPDGLSRGIELDGFRAEGDSTTSGQRTGVAMKFEGDLADSNLYGLRFQNWNNNVIQIDASGFWYRSTATRLFLSGCDAGNDDAIMHFDGGAFGVNFQHLLFQCFDDYSGADSDLINTTKNAATLSNIGYIQALNHTKRVLDQDGGHINIGLVQIESSPQNTGTGFMRFNLNGVNWTKISGVYALSGDANRIYKVGAATNSAELGQPFYSSDTTMTLSDTGTLSNSPQATVVYMGPSADWTNFGADGGNLACVGDFSFADPTP